MATIGTCGYLCVDGCRAGEVVYFSGVCCEPEIRVEPYRGSYRVIRGDEYLDHRGTWGGVCYLFFSQREAEVAAVLAGMSTPDKKRADEAVAKANVLKQQSDRLVQANFDLCSERGSLLAEVAKLKGDLAQIALVDSYRRTVACGKIARGEPCDFPKGLSECVNSVRKLRADYEALLAEKNLPRADYGAMYSSVCKQLDAARKALA